SRWGCWSKTGSYGFLFPRRTQVSAHGVCAARTIVAQNAAGGEGKFHQKKPPRFTQNAQKSPGRTTGAQGRDIECADRKRRALEIKQIKQLFPEGEGL